MSFDYGKYFGEIKLTHDLLSKKEERTWLLKPPRDGERHDVVLYLGCNVLRTSHLVETVGAVFDRLGLDRGGDPEDPKSESELKVVAGLIRSRARVDPARLADEAVELSRLVPAPA